MDLKLQDHEQSWIFKRHEVFVRSARDASHQVLFFLGMLYTPNCASFGKKVEDYWKTALHRIMAIVRGVYVPSFPEDRSTDPEAPAPDTAPPEDGPAHDEMERVLRIKAEWRELRDILSWDRAQGYPFEDEKIQGLRDSVTSFLEHSRAQRKVQYIFEHGLADIFRWGCRHLALFLAATLLAALSLWVDAIKGLLWNEGWLKLLFYVVFLPLPFYMHWWINHRVGDGNKIFCLSMASRPFWQRKPLAVGPGRMIQRWPDEPSILGAILKCQVIKIIVYICFSSLAACIIYWIQGRMRFAPAMITPCILVIFYLILLAANQIDFWDFIFYAPLRAIGLLLVLILLLGLWFGWGRPTFIGVLVGVGVVLVMFHMVTRRWRKTLLGFGVLAAVLALFTIVAWHTNRERIWQSDRNDQFQRLTADKWPHVSANPVVLMIASGGGSRAAVFTGLTLQHLNKDYPEIARQLQAISSVSGGSLANAAYLARLLSAGEAGRSKASLAAMVESLADDFLLPTLVGALVPFKSRSASIERKWQEGGVRLGHYSLKDLADHWENCGRSDAPPFPIPLFNTTTLEAHDLVISPLSADCYTNMELHRQAADEKTNCYHRHAAPCKDDPVTWVYYRHCVYALENLLPERNLPLSSAVLASANFPFGFPVVKVEPDEDLRAPLYFSPRPHPRPYSAKLTDGGALSNSGMWPMFNLLVNKKSDLAKRGVLLIIVEASKMPSYRSMRNSFNRLRGTIDDQAPIGRNLHEMMFSYLDALYDGRFATVQLDLTPRKSTNIMTTWALDKKSLGTLITDFENTAWRDKKARIGNLWRYLKSKGKKRPKLNDRLECQRLPLD